MSSNKDNVVVGLLVIIAVLLVLNLFATRFETQVLQAASPNSSNGWIAFSGQKADGPEMVYIINTQKGPIRRSGKTMWSDNGPRLAAYKISSSGKIQFTSMRNVGPDLDFYIDALYRDPSSPKVKDIKKKNRSARAIGSSEEATGGGGGDDDLPEDSD